MDENLSDPPEFETPGLSVAVGQAVRRHRLIAGTSLRKLAEMSGISSAMVSRIENGQVSPSLSTLEALAEALSLPVVTFFADSVRTADAHYVKAGQGIPATRSFDDRLHEFRILGRHRKSPLEFEAASITVERRRGDTHPRYINSGYVFITVTKGECIYQCGRRTFAMSPGDSLSFDAGLIHGVREVVSGAVTYISVSARMT